MSTPSHARLEAGADSGTDSGTASGTATRARSATAAAPALPQGSLVPPPARSGPDFAALDALRAVGALCVLTTHVAFWSGDYTGNGFWGTLLARLDVGVALFFVLSGFLLARPWLAATADRRPTPATPDYLWKRFLRIAPLYVVTAALALAFVRSNADLSWGDRIATLLMLDTFRSPLLPGGLTHMWSLAVEVTFYLALPALMVALLGRRRVRAARGLRPARVLVGIAALVVVTAWWHLDGAARVSPHTDGAPLQWLPAYLSWFALGLLLALAHVLHERGAWERLTAPLVALGRQPGSCWALVAGLLLVAATPVAGPSMLDAPTPGQSLTKSLLYAVVGLLVVVTGVFADPASRYARGLSHPAARRLGWISFGIFCLHLPLLHLVMWATPWELFEGHGVPLWLLTLALSLVAAEVSYRLVERPAMRLRGLVGSRSANRPGSRTPSGPATSSPTSGTSIR